MPDNVRGVAVRKPDEGSREDLMGQIARGGNSGDGAQDPIVAGRDMLDSDLNTPTG